MSSDIIKSKYFNCLFCEKEKLSRHGHAAVNKYCSTLCHKAYENKIKIKDWLDKGNCKPSGKSTPRFIVRYVKQQAKNTCQKCQNSKWNGIPIHLEVDHIDGDYTNNNILNLQALCPNCHSQTPTFKNLNYGNGRKLGKR